MRFLAITTWKDLLRLGRDPSAIAGWILMPAIMTTLVALIFGGGTPKPEGKLLVVDRDQTIASGLLTGIFQRDPLSQMVRMETVDYADGRRRVDAAEASALLIVPKGFQDAVLRRQPYALTLITDPSERIIPAVIADSLGLALDGVFYLQQLGGDQVASMATRSGPPTDAEIAAIALDFARMGRANGWYLNPKLIQLQTLTPPKPKGAQPAVSFAAIFFPGMLMLAVFGMAQSASEDLWREKNLGTMRRLMSTPRSVAALLAGKVMALAIFAGGLGAVGMAIAGPALNAPVHHFVAAVVWVAATGAGLYLMAATLQFWASDQRAGAVLNGFVLFVLGMAGGNFFPFEIMPKWLASIGRVTPNGWLIARFRELIGGSLAPSAAARDFAILAIVLAAVFGLLARRARAWAV